MKMLLTGDEAIARGAYEAGVKFASAYPGTPSTEILENISTYPEIKSEWAPNEKTAFEAAAGAAIAGVRSFASMKHVGVNVAADPMFTLSYTGINAGMVFVSADEPGQHSSQNEQDNRYYALSAKLPMLEPSDSTECRDMVLEAFRLSEEYDTPVMLRVTTRICHAKSLVDCTERNEPATKEYTKNIAKYVTVPALARLMRVKVEERMNKLAEFSSTTPLNRIEKGGKIGVVASGAAYCYAREVFGDDATYLKLGYTNPLPDKLLAEFYTMVDKVYVIEENDPYLENWIKSCGYKCHGKDVFPAYGELTQDVIRKCVNGSELPGIEYKKELAVPRPPALCAGCPHRGLFYELAKKKNTVVMGDIGCYTLASAAPYNSLDSAICMGAAFSVGHGAQTAFDVSDRKGTRVVGVMGDSTFFHTGINSMMEVFYNNSRTICIILDNRITGMTGHQENPGSGKTAQGDVAQEISIETVVRALGAKNVSVINPNNLAEVRKALDDAFATDEPSVIITRWPCVLKRMDAEERSEYGDDLFRKKYSVDVEKCVGCKLCIRGGCPAVSFDGESKKSNIDADACVGCSVCAQICPKAAISEVRL